MADCRLCRFYVPEILMSDYLKKWAQQWVSQNRPGSQVLGYCERFGRPVTYYIGSCNGFRPRVKEVRLRSLDEFLKAEEGG